MKTQPLIHEDDMAYLANLRKHAAPEFDAWHQLNNMVRSQQGAIPWRYRELIALAVAQTTQCVYCIRAHVEAAREAGATREEIAESTFIAAALRAGGAVAYGAVALRFFDGCSACDAWDQPGDRC